MWCGVGSGDFELDSLAVAMAFQLHFCFWSWGVIILLLLRLRIVYGIFIRRLIIRRVVGVSLKRLDQVAVNSFATLWETFPAWYVGQPDTHSTIFGVIDENLILHSGDLVLVLILVPFIAAAAAAGNHTTAKTDIIKVLFFDIDIAAADTTEMTNDGFRCFVAFGFSVNFECRVRGFG